MLAAALVYLVGSLTAHAQPPGAIVAEVSGLRGSRGMVDCYLYSSANGFPSDPSRSLRTDVVVANDGMATCRFTGVAMGAYAIAVVHDANGNGKLDRNLLGMPIEGVGASNNPTSRFGPPPFAKASFVYLGAFTKLSIQVRYL